MENYIQKLTFEKKLIEQKRLKDNHENCVQEKKIILDQKENEVAILMNELENQREKNLELNTMVNKLSIENPNNDNLMKSKIESHRESCRMVSKESNFIKREFSKQNEDYKN